uniref:EGF-like domain-containing protein n=1 Tax=Quercus lobata TaxID=97700 RepID=A0A7N2MKF6_QUELO
MVGGSDDVVDGTTSSAAWRGVVIRPWVVVDVVGQTLIWENSGAMGFHSMLVQVIWVGMMLTTIMAAAARAYPLALPDCSDSCGDVEIPYPFGTTEGCYRKEEAYSFKSHKEVWYFNPCSFASIIQRDKFNFSSAYLTSLQNNSTLPMVLDWAIGNETCEAAQNKGNYICGANSTCSDHNNGSGYRCNCEQGYEGNPYLKNGCQAINLLMTRKLSLPVHRGIPSGREARAADQPAPKSSLAINLTVVQLDTGPKPH